MSELSLDEYRKRDYRLLCQVCRRWMRNKPTRKTPAKRRPPPNAGTCTDCTPKPRYILPTPDPYLKITSG